MIINLLGNKSIKWALYRLICGFRRSLRSNRYVFASIVAFMVMTFAISGQTNNIHMATAFAYSNSEDVFHLSYHFPDGEEQSMNARLRYVQNVASLLQEDSTNFKKLNAEDMLTVFNRPDMGREDLGVVVWQYKSEDCVLDVYFDTGTGEKLTPIDESIVVHYDIRQRGVVSHGDKIDDLDSDIKNTKQQASCILSIFYEKNYDVITNEKFAYNYK